MNIEASNENEITVDLTRQDMTELDISYEEMDYANIETRRVIWTLLDKAGQALGRDIDPTGRMMIEAMPRQNGGCVMRFTILREEKREPRAQKSLVKREESVLTYEFRDVNDLLDCAQRFWQMGFPPMQSSLLAREGCYRLLLRTPRGSRRLDAFFSEYARVCAGGAVTAAVTQEHWQTVAARDALEKLGRVTQ